LAILIYSLRGIHKKQQNSAADSCGAESRLV